ncbi:MAG TPA: hypothetical protein VEL74_17835 [Thermoanaerobaculia bacterium]|nr:hypothetical protein [Thermoanaerobaculia bacterium]
MIDSSNTHERYVTDGAGNRIGVILTLDEYSQLMEAAEELEAIRAFDDAKASGDEAIPFEQAGHEVQPGERDPLGNLVGLLRHRANSEPVSVEEMGEAIRARAAEKYGDRKGG